MVNESNMQHGRDYSSQEVYGWLMSEKLNGCRAYWDGECMWSRGGKEIIIPHAMRAMLPINHHLDGEMYCPLDFNNAKRAVQYSRFADSVTFYAFDVPSHDGVFADRYHLLRQLLKPHTHHVRMVAQYFCGHIDEAVEWMKIIQGCGGEGVMLHDPEDLYAPGRTFGLLKLKEAP